MVGRNEALGMLLGLEPANFLNEPQLGGVMSRDILHLSLRTVYRDKDTRLQRSRGTSPLQPSHYHWYL